MSFEIRPATPDDAPTILRFVRELAAYEREPDAVEATVESLRAQLSAERPPFECLLALDPEPVGFALYFHNYSTWRGRPGLYLEDLYVTPSARTRGIGRALLVRLAAIAVERGCARMEWAVLDWNQPAWAFYRALGAEPLEGWTLFRLTGQPLSDLASPPPAADPPRTNPA